MTENIVRGAIQALPVYNSGAPLAVVKAELGLETIAKLDSNENPIGMSVAARTAAIAAVDQAYRYPDRDETELRADLAHALNVDPNCLVFSGGSEDVLSIIYRMVLEPEHTVVTVSPGFGLHAIFGQVAGAHIEVHQHLADWSFPVDAIVSSIHAGARIVALASPSNPVGVMLTDADIEQILAAAGPQCLLIFDEAYIEFAGPQWRLQLLQRLARHQGPWALLRTFAKAYGLAGLRIGYGVVHCADFAANFNKTRSPFNVNALALAAAQAAYADTDHLTRVVSETLVRRAKMAAAIRAAGFSFAPSVGNFLFIDSGADAVSFARALRQHGVLVKPWLEAGYESYFRATVGTDAEIEMLISAMISVRESQTADAR